MPGVTGAAFTPDAKNAASANSPWRDRILPRIVPSSDRPGLYDPCRGPICLRRGPMLVFC